MTKTIVAGSREGVTLEAVEQAMSEAPFVITEVISGTARGADRYGEQVAQKYNVPIRRFPADWNQYGKRAGYIRNAEMSNNAEALVAVWNGHSRGTKHMIDLAKRKGLKIHIHKV